jgi:hypothetical protein
MDKQQRDATDHLRMMDLRIEMKREKIARLSQTEADISQAAKTLTLLQKTKQEMALQLALLTAPTTEREWPL